MQCKHIQENGIKKDGEYDLYLMRPDNDKTARIYCADMNTANPLEYITLSAGKANNVMIHYHKQTHQRQETYFEKVIRTGRK